MWVPSGTICVCGADVTSDLYSRETNDRNITRVGNYEEKPGWEWFLSHGMLFDWTYNSVAGCPQGKPMNT